ncbi:MAG: rhomboid family intramembrane serine protease [Succinivibrionaceae bacterium]
MSLKWIEQPSYKNSSQEREYSIINKYYSKVTIVISLLAIFSYILGQFFNFYEFLFFKSWLIIDNWNLWRVLTPIFIHFSIVHLLFNVVIFWNLSGDIERYQGKLKILSLVLLSAIVSNSFQYYLNNGNCNFGGLSGVVNSVISYMMVISFVHIFSLKYYIARSLFILSFIFVICGYLFKLNFANECHLFGLLFGLFYGVFDIFFSKKLKKYSKI